jgi:hypothetical protein
MYLPFYNSACSLLFFSRLISKQKLYSPIIGLLVSGIDQMLRRGSDRVNVGRLLKVAAEL